MFLLIMTVVVLNRASQQWALRKSLFYRFFVQQFEFTYCFLRLASFASRSTLSTNLSSSDMKRSAKYKKYRLFDSSIDQFVDSFDSFDQRLQGAYGVVWRATWRDMEVKLKPKSTEITF